MTTQQKGDEEIWKHIPLYGGDYQVSNLGNLRSMKQGKVRLMRPGVNSRGYYAVCLYYKNIKTGKNVHRLVALAFLENSESKEQVNHINGNKLDNRVANLEWCTCAENIRHGFKTGLIVSSKKGKTGADSTTSKPISQFTIGGEFIKHWVSIIEAARALGINSSGICACLKGKHSQTGGYKWAYEPTK